MNGLPQDSGLGRIRNRCFKFFIMAEKTLIQSPTDGSDTNGGLGFLNSIGV